MPSPSRRVLTVLDPATLIGRELLDHLVERAPGLRRAFFHTTEADEHLIAEIAGEASLVAPLADLEELVGSHVVVATRQPSPAMAARLVGWLRAHATVTLVDLTEQGLAEADSTVVFDRPPEQGVRWFRFLDPSLVGAAFFLRALAPLAPEELHITAIRPASAYGEGGVEELADQGVARLSGRRPPRPAHLPSVLAFDLAPSADRYRTSLERQMREAFPEVTVHIRALEAGVFHGHLATVGARLGTVPRLDELRALLGTSSVLRLSRRNAMAHPSDAVGTYAVTCSDLTIEPPWILATLTADGLRLTSGLLAAELVLTVLDQEEAGVEPVH